MRVLSTSASAGSSGGREEFSHGHLQARRREVERSAPDDARQDLIPIAARVVDDEALVGIDDQVMLRARQPGPAIDQRIRLVRRVLVDPHGHAVGEHPAFELARAIAAASAEATACLTSA
jgi:hypothetical protein